MRIGNHLIGRDHPPYVVAEISGNHMGSYDRACELIAAAKRAGADAVKLQAFDPVRLAEQRGGADRIIAGGPWHGMTLGDLYQQAHTPLAWFKDLHEVAHNAGITIFPSIFHAEMVDELEQIADWPVYKVSSFNMTDAVLLQRLQMTGKPLIISTGMASLNEAVEGLAPYCDFKVEDFGLTDVKPAAEVAVLHCVSEYPCPSDMVNISRISQLQAYFSRVGFSDHTRDFVASVMAVSRGACIIEKHLMLNRCEPCVDKAFSMTPSEFWKLVYDCHDAWIMMQKPRRSDDAYASMKVVSRTNSEGENDGRAVE